MARQKNSIDQAIQAVTNALEASVDGTMTLQQQNAAVKMAATVVRTSNFRTLGQNADAAIELQHQFEEQAALEAGQAVQVETVVEERVGLPAMSFDDIPELEEDEDDIDF